jgi:predicted RNA binding protein YcfA (HicA-like mRNA interferase family)
MPKIPRITGDDAVRAFRRAGYEVDRIAGSHHILKRPGSPRLSIPCHKGKMIGLGLLRDQITAAGLTVEEFIALL